MPRFAWDTWAFLETYFEWPRHGEVRAVAAQAQAIVTVRDVIAETFNHIVRKTGKTEEGWRWWESVRASRVRVLEPSLGEVREFLADRKRTGALSFTDHALALVALREGAEAVATEDAEFRRFGLDPVFARR